MKINIIFGSNTWCGALRSTYELANHMAEVGHDVVMYIPFMPSLNGHNLLSREGLYLFVRGIGRGLIRWNQVPWFENLRVPLQIVPVCTDRFIRDADVVMANQWPTAYSVAALSSRKGRKFHFVRDTEPWPGQEKFVAESYRLPLEKIVVAPWLKEHIESKAGVEVRGVVMNGINFPQFQVSDKHYNDPPVICMNVLQSDPRKGTADGFKALAVVKQRRPDVKIRLFGWKRPTGVPFNAEFHYRPVKEQLRSVYGGSDIFLATSRREGFHNPPREAMAAQCAVVATRIGSIPYCTIPGETALVVEPGDVDGMVQAMFWLLEDPLRIRLIGRRGYEHIQQFTWQDAAARLLTIFESGERR